MPYPVGTVWCVGDSKTYGVTSAGSCGPRDPMTTTFLLGAGGSLLGTQEGGYNPLGGTLDPCPISGLPLLSDGHPGYTCQNITDNIASWYTGVPASRLAILYIGTNDLIAISEGTPGATVDKLYGDFAACLAACLALNTTTTWFVCNIDPMPGLSATPEWAQLNAFIGAQVKQCQRQGRSVFLIDLAGVAGITYDPGNVHQDVAGYAVTATRMVAAVSTLRPAG